MHLLVVKYAMAYYYNTSRNTIFHAIIIFHSLWYALHKAKMIKQYTWMLCVLQLAHLTSNATKHWSKCTRFAQLKKVRVN